ncbi:hypothetical protein MRX96_047958 [Rhipicephalus microplus]
MKRRAARVKGLLGVGGHACPAQLPAFVPNQGRASCGFAQGPAYFRKSLASFLACSTTLASALTRHHALASTRSRGLAVSPVKTKALLVHPRPRTRRVARLTIQGTTIPWESTVTYLGLRIDHRLSSALTVKEAICMVKRIQKAVKGTFISGRGYLPSWALRLYTAAATSRLLYAFHVVALPRRLLERLELLHRGFFHCVLGLSRCYQVTTALAEAGVWPLSLLLKQRGLLHIDRLAHAPDGCPPCCPAT